MDLFAKKIIKTPQKKIYVWLTDLDPDGRSRRLIVRILIALALGASLFFALNIELKFLIWLILCTTNGLIALSFAPKDYLLRYFLLSAFANLIALVCGVFLNHNSQYFIFVVALLGFASGLTGGFGQSGKSIGAMGFVLFAVTSFIDVKYEEIGKVLEVFSISLAAIYATIFFAIPIPREKIIKANSQATFKILKEILSQKTHFNDVTINEIFRGVKDGLCARLPNDCECFMERYVSLKNISTTLINYDVILYADKPFFVAIYEQIEIFKIAAIKLFGALSKDEDVTNTFNDFLNAKQNLIKAIHSAIDYHETELDQDEIIHIGMASFMALEMEIIIRKEIGL